MLDKLFPLFFPLSALFFSFSYFFSSPWVVSSSNFRIYDCKGTPTDEEVGAQERGGKSPAGSRSELGPVLFALT